MAAEDWQSMVVGGCRQQDLGLWRRMKRKKKEGERNEIIIIISNILIYLLFKIKKKINKKILCHIMINLLIMLQKLGRETKIKRNPNLKD